MNLLKAHFQDVEKAILANSNIAGNTGHPNHKGGPRETFVSEFLCRHLSEKVTIGSGEIINSNSKKGESRNQHDIVIYLNDFPKITIDSKVTLFMVESVVATIEVKSKLTFTELEKSILAARRTKLLSRKKSKSPFVGYVPPNIISYVVAYGGPAKIVTVAGWIRKIYKKHNIQDYPLPLSAARHMKASPSIDGVLILGNGILMYDNAPATFGNPVDHPGLNWVFGSTPDSLLILFGLLTQALSGAILAPVNAFEYVQHARLNEICYA